MPFGDALLANCNHHHLIKGNYSSSVAAEEKNLPLGVLIDALLMERKIHVNSEDSCPHLGRCEGSCGFLRCPRLEWRNLLFLHPHTCIEVSGPSKGKSRNVGGCRFGQRLVLSNSVPYARDRNWNSEGWCHCFRVSQELREQSGCQEPKMMPDSGLWGECSGH